MKLINMSSDKQSFMICSFNGNNQFKIQEMLFIKEGNSTKPSGKTFSYIEYKIRVSLDRFSFKTYTVWNISSKKEWYIIDNCIDLVAPHKGTTIEYNH